MWNAIALDGQRKRIWISVLHHRLNKRLCLQQFVPSHLPVDDVQRIRPGLVGGDESPQRVPKQPERLCRFMMRVGAALLFPVICLRKQSPYQFAEHCYGIIGQLLCELDELGDDSRPTARNIEIGDKPSRCNVSFANHLVPAFRLNPILKLGIDLQGADEGKSLHQSDQVITDRRIGGRPS